MGSKKKKKKRGRGRICGGKPGRGKSHHQRGGERDFGGRIAQTDPIGNYRNGSRGAESMLNPILRFLKIARNT